MTASQVHMVRTGMLSNRSRLDTPPQQQRPNTPGKNGTTMYIYLLLVDARQDLSLISSVQTAKMLDHLIFDLWRAGDPREQRVPGTSSDVDRSENAYVRQVIEQYGQAE